MRSHANFIAKKELPFALISDPDHELTEMCGFWAEKKFMGKTFMGVVRSTLILDEQGKGENILEKFKVAEHVNVLLEALEN